MGRGSVKRLGVVGEGVGVGGSNSLTHLPQMRKQDKY